VGLVLASIAVLFRGRAAVEGGVLEVHGGLLTKVMGGLGRGNLVIWAITLGHVVLALDDSSLRKTRRHERVHVRQYERLGILFPFLYAASSFLAFSRGKDPYMDNVFEREAFEQDFEEPGVQ
jgi:hypothetical protein